MKPSSGHTYILWSLCWFLTVLKFLSAVYYLMNANFCEASSEVLHCTPAANKFCFSLTVLTLFHHTTCIVKRTEKYDKNLLIFVLTCGAGRCFDRVTARYYQFIYIIKKAQSSLKYPHTIIQTSAFIFCLFPNESMQNNYV